MIESSTFVYSGWMYWSLGMRRWWYVPPVMKPDLPVLVTLPTNTPPVILMSQAFSPFAETLAFFSKLPSLIWSFTAGL